MLYWMGSTLKMHWKIAGLAIVGAAVTVGGCLAPPPPLTRVVDTTGPAPTPVSVAASERVHTPLGMSFDYVKPDGSGPTRRVITEADENGRWNAELFRVAPDGVESPIERAVFRAVSTDTGRVVYLEEVWDFPENRITRFDPAIVFFPDTIGPGESHTDESEIAIVALNNPDRVNQTGGAKIEVTNKGEGRFEIGDITLEALEIETVLRFDVGPADVKRTTESWYAPRAEGFFPLLAERTHLKVTVGPLPWKDEWMMSVREDIAARSSTGE